jgi:glycosyltransferase involved in cell wall biosynthesis
MPTGVVKIVQSVWNIASSLLFAIALLALGTLRVEAICSSSAQSQGFVASVLSAIWRLPLVVDYGDPSFVRDTGMQRRMVSLLERVSLNTSDAVMSADPVISRYVYSRYRKMPILLPSGYDSTLFPGSACTSQRSLADRIVTFVGKIDISLYRLDILLLASKHVIEAIPEARFRLIGAGPDISKLKQMASDLGVQESVDFLGFVPHEKVMSWIRDSEVCVNVTNDTCLGMKVMEYMASGKPTVIAAPWWDKYRSLIMSGHNCLTVPLDPDRLAAAILKVMRDRDFAARLGRNAYETVRHYSWDKISETMIETVWALVHDKENPQSVRFPHSSGR